MVKCKLTAENKTIGSGRRKAGSANEERRLLMKHHSVILARLLLGLAVAGGLHYAAASASAQRTSVTVPFAFTANHESMPAGFYEVQMLSDRFMALRNSVTRETQVFLVPPG